MRKFEWFYFEKFSFDFKNLKAHFFYSFDKKEKFEEVIDFSCDKEFNNIYDINILNNFLFNLFIALWISYYKIFPVDDLFVEMWYLKKSQIDFWKKFYLYWLWEFFVKNNFEIPKFNFINLDNNCNTSYNYCNLKSEKSLLMWWWGKDSIVSYNFIKNIEFDIFVVGKLDKIKQNTIKITWKCPIILKRDISKNLFKLNEKWYYNWHVPITWIIAFISLVFSYLYNYKYTILSNEKSSSEENMIYKWIKINHQYSKSFEFEKDFSKYVIENITNNIKYFSLLRWMYEYKISKEFSNCQDFFSSFSSCNNNFKINWKIINKNWCCNCEKCAFVFLILSNFINLDKLVNIFWENLFDKKNLLGTFILLIWFWDNKPFECVWTYEESFISIYNAIAKYKKNKFYILDKIENLYFSKFKKYDEKKVKNKLLKIYNNDIIPSIFKKLLFENNEN